MIIRQNLSPLELIIISGAGLDSREFAIVETTKEMFSNFEI